MEIVLHNMISGCDKMKNFIFIISIILFTSLLGCFNADANNQNSHTSKKDASMKDRVAKIKESTVRILVDERPVGTGFIVSKKGLVATCFHVVQHAQTTVNGQTQITHATNIKVEFSDGIKSPATIHQACQNQGFQKALSRDYAILVVKPHKILVPLALGKFTDIEEGEEVYTCGFPFGLDKPFVSKGLLSTKITTPGYLGQGVDRDAALLDITLNKGNSGGPVVLIGKNPQDDKVIGIATFTLTPLSPALAQLAEGIQKFPGGVKIMGVDFKQFSMLIKNSFDASSVGIGGCISVDYMKNLSLKTNR